MTQDFRETSIRLIRVNPEGNRAVSVAADGSLQLWDVMNTSEIHKLIGHEAAVTEVAFLPDCSAIVSASKDRSIRVWDSETGTAIASFFADSPLATCAVVSDQPIVIAGDQLGRTYFLRVEGMTGKSGTQRPKDTRKRSARGVVPSNLRRRFDVFLCHNSVDKPFVRRLNEKLKARNILPWLDEEQIRPGTDWMDSLEEQIFEIRSAAVVVGGDGVGPWQSLEVKALLRKFVKKGSPVIPVILDNCEREPDIPSFLEGFHRVDFRLSSPDPLEQLIWGITGKRSP